MNPHPNLETGVNWLLNHSLQAAVLVLGVLLVQWAFRRQLTNRWRFALWWIVLVRLLLPFGPESALSVFNVFQPYVQLEGPRYAPRVSAAKPAGQIFKQTTPSAAAPEAVPFTADPQAMVPIQAAPTVPPPVIAPSVTHPHSFSWDDWLIPGLAGLWLAGVLLFAGIVAVQCRRFYRKLAGASAPADPSLAALLEECRREFQVSRKIELLETEAVQSPGIVWSVPFAVVAAARAGRAIRAVRTALYIFARTGPCEARRSLAELAGDGIANPALVQSAIVAGICTVAGGPGAGVR